MPCETPAHAPVKGLFTPEQTSTQTEKKDKIMETTKITISGMRVSRIALGTWAMGGWMWGGTEEKDAIRTITTAVDNGITLIDTAPVYGFGRSEEIVGK